VKTNKVAIEATESKAAGPSCPVSAHAGQDGVIKVKCKFLTRDKTVFYKLPANLPAELEELDSYITHGINVARLMQRR